MVFVCRYERDTFAAKIGIGRKPHAVVYNGLWPEEFAELPVNADAADVVFIGDMRLFKGVDVLIEALARCNRTRRTTAVLAGDGPDLALFEGRVKERGIDDVVVFSGRLAIAEALPRGRLLVMPSRAESFPYVVLEACAAGKPLIASDVGGIPEILEKAQLVRPGDAGALAASLLSALNDPAAVTQSAGIVRATIRRKFTADAMVDGVLSFYSQVSAAGPSRNTPLTRP
jgi:glycosyltransferase involved in cell wall biosynthesis